MIFPISIKSRSYTDTESVGVDLARAILENTSLPRFLALYGDLGVGKTAFTRGFTSVIAPSARVKSPTFALVNQYKGEEISVFHFDMYRITSEDELYSIGFFDYTESMNICITEWSENIEYALPPSFVRVEIVKDDTNDTDSRRIDIQLVTAEL
ncbi:MAG: tRNA (adenosine(37)-N6)-threonylcarbamoyltransferase complex ATPase subunit type 1 TsaE [Ruminococcaceae bacterium]|nr:tRNA (adenosine(37)-N6)-threonylcarbamoyltransferase complex ATPase subunit type 1 TsaE [Oscillospiraceae bacterium]